MSACRQECGWQGAAVGGSTPKSAACFGSVVLDVRVDLENVPGLIPRQKLGASEAATERSQKKRGLSFYP